LVTEDNGLWKGLLDRDFPIPQRKQVLQGKRKEKTTTNPYLVLYKEEYETPQCEGLAVRLSCTRSPGLFPHVEPDSIYLQEDAKRYLFDFWKAQEVLSTLTFVVTLINLTDSPLNIPTGFRQYTNTLLDGTCYRLSFEGTKIEPKYIGTGTCGYGFEDTFIELGPKERKEIETTAVLVKFGEPEPVPFRLFFTGNWQYCLCVADPTKAYIYAELNEETKPEQAGKWWKGVIQSKSLALLGN